MTTNEEYIATSWLMKLLCVDFAGKETIVRQLNQSNAVLVHHHASILIKFHVCSDVPLLPWKIGSPISMTAIQKDTAPVFFVLHVVDSVVVELEVGMDDLSKIDMLAIDLSDVEYSFGQLSKSKKHNQSEETASNITFLSFKIIT
jgi:hypothetical protein